MMRLFFCCLLLISSVYESRAQTPDLDVDAVAWVLYEPSTQTVVAQKNADLPLPPASITKLMTNYVLFSKLQRGEISMGDEVYISENAWRAIGSRMFADVGTRIPFGELIRSSIIQSGNDAAIAMAEFAGGTEAGFAQQMNATAAELGLEHSHFENATGLSADSHLMSSLDIVKLGAALIEDFPEFYSWYSEKEYTHNGIRQFNRNKLLWKDDSVDGLKTGYTEAAGYCLVGSAKRKGTRWLAVVMGAKGVSQREAEVLKLLNYGFNNYDVANPFIDDEISSTIRVYGGEADELSLSIDDTTPVLVKRGQASKLNYEILQSPWVKAPISAGQSLGVVQLKLGDEIVAERTLVAQQAVAKGGWWKRLSDSVKLSISDLFAD